MAAALTTGVGMLVPLNREPQRGRTLELSELLRTLGEIERMEAAAAIKRQPTIDRNSATKPLYKRANQLLSTCRWSPRIHPVDGNRHYFAWKAETEQSDWENRFVFWILRVFEEGDLGLIRSCRYCNRWFFAVTDHQIHCTIRCRQQFHSSDARFKEKRRLYMRGYRDAEKRRVALEQKLSANKGAPKAAPALQVKKKGGQ
jgi:hypothetical protein